MEEKFVEAVGKAGDGGADFAGIHVETSVDAPEGIGGAQADNLRRLSR